MKYDLLTFFEILWGVKSFQRLKFQIIKDTIGCIPKCTEKFFERDRKHARKKK